MFAYSWIDLSIEIDLGLLFVQLVTSRRMRDVQASTSGVAHFGMNSHGLRGAFVMRFSRHSCLDSERYAHVFRSKYLLCLFDLAGCRELSSRKVKNPSAKHQCLTKRIDLWSRTCRLWSRFNALFTHRKLHAKAWETAFNLIRTAFVRISHIEYVAACRSILSRHSGSRALVDTSAHQDHGYMYTTKIPILFYFPLHLQQRVV